MSGSKFPPKLKQESRVIREMIVFLLNGLIFILIGLELPIVLKTIDSNHLLVYAGYALILAIAALLLTTWRVFLKRKRLLSGYNDPRLKNTRRAIYRSTEFRS